MSIDKFFKRKYDKDKYNCAHLVSEAWKEETGQDIEKTLSGFLLPVSQRTALIEIRHDFVRLQAPESPCIVLMHRPRYAPHVGIYLRGKVLHIQENGVQFQPIEVASLGFKQLRYYNVKTDSIG